VGVSFGGGVGVVVVVGVGVPFGGGVGVVVVVGVGVSFGGGVGVAVGVDVGDGVAVVLGVAVGAGVAVAVAVGAGVVVGLGVDVGVLVSVPVPVPVPDSESDPFVPDSTAWASIPALWPSLSPATSASETPATADSGATTGPATTSTVTTTVRHASAVESSIIVPPQGSALRRCFQAETPSPDPSPAIVVLDPVLLANVPRRQSERFPDSSCGSAPPFPTVSPERTVRYPDESHPGTKVGCLGT
jgi:hypothetical protein